MIAKLICKLFGHKRGKRVSGFPIEMSPEQCKGKVRFECPRCKATWTRKVKA